MGIIEIRADWYNPRSPKCRNCKSWNGKQGELSGAKCNEPKFKGLPFRWHNSRACVQFKFLRPAA